MDRIQSEYVSWTNPEDRTLTSGELYEAAAKLQADVLLVMAMDRLDAATIDGLPPTVRAIATLSVGHEHIDLEAARARGIAVLNMPDVLSDAVAEMAMLLLLGAARRAHEGAELLYSGRWGGWSPTQLLGRDVTGARIGIFGMGRIGRAISRRASRGFEMQVHYHNRSRLPAELEEGSTFHPTASALLAESEFLVLAAPSTGATKGFLNAATLAQLPRGAVVVNIARGDLVDDEALISALRSGHIAAAGLDVFNNEPHIHEGYKALPNVFLQPHQGSSTIGTRVRMGELLLDSINAYLRGASSANRLV
jgi:glyoxylate reductase